MTRFCVELFCYKMVLFIFNMTSYLLCEITIITNDYTIKLGHNSIKINLNYLLF